MNDQKKAYCAAGGVAGLGGTAAVLAPCCAAPWAVGLLNAASAAALARYHFLQPFLLAAAALLAGGVFWLAYRQRPDPRTEIVRLRLRSLAWGTGALLLGFVLVGFGLSESRI